MASKPAKPAVAAKPAAAAKPTNKWGDEDEDDAPAAEPAKRAAKKEEPVKLSADLGSLVDSWADDEDD